MKDWLLIISYLIGILIIGDTISGILRIRFHSIIERIGLAVILGTGTLSVIIFWMGLIKIPFSRSVIILVYILFIILYYFFHPRFNVSFHSLSLIEKFSIALIIIYLIIITLDSITTPLNAGDALSIWGFKAKIIYSNGIYGFSHPYRIIVHPRYPLLIPIIESGFYKFLGNIDDRIVKQIFPFLFFSLMLFLYVFQREMHIKRKYALSMLFLLILIPYYYSMRGGRIGSGFVDIPLSTYIIGAMFYFVKYLRRKETKYIILTGILTAFTIFTKNEGIGIFSFIGIYIALESIKKTIPIKDIFLYFSFVIILILPWLIFRTHLSYQYDENYLSHLSVFFKNLHRLPFILWYLSKEMINPLKWAFFWYISLFIFIIKPKSFFQKENKILFLYIIFTLFFYISIFVITPWKNYKYQMVVCWGRLLLHIAPVSFVLISKIFYDLSK